jgi:PIN domain nuclease of toxin-antitoxin system
VNLAIDTHALKWWLEDDDRLGQAASIELEQADAVLLVPTLVLVELEYIGKKKGVLRYLRDQFDYLETSRDVRVLPFDREAVELLNVRFNIHDAIIVATAQAFSQRTHESVSVVTRDGEIHRSGLVDVVW